MKSTYKISLRLRHPSIKHTAITSALGLKPDYAGTAGEPCKGPKGHALEGVNDYTFWHFRFPDGRSTGLARELWEITSKLEAKAPFFRRFHSSGGEAEFFIGWFINRNTGDAFYSKLLAKLAALKIDLSFDVYPPDK